MFPRDFSDEVTNCDPAILVANLRWLAPAADCRAGLERIVCFLIRRGCADDVVAFLAEEIPFPAKL
jgi:hypothetical protein